MRARWGQGHAFEISRDEGSGGQRASWGVSRTKAARQQRHSVPARPIELVGRESETTKLAAIWRRVVLGGAGLVCIEGEAGIGKSALLHWLEHQALGEGCVVLDVHCLPETRHLALDPVRILVDMLELLDAPMHERRERCGALISTEPVADDLEGQALAVRCRALLAQSDVDIEELGADLLRLAIRKSEARPLLISIEDLHWADQSTVRLIDGLDLADASSGRVMFVATVRAGARKQTPLSGGEGRLRLQPGRLSKIHIERILTANETAADLDEEQRKRIVSMADGNPFHACELARIVAVGETASPYRRLLALPNRLNPGLAERLDALGSLKPLAQAAAVLGRTFDARVLAAALQMDARGVKERLEQLVEAGILAKSRSVSSNDFRFHDALLWTQAYGSVLRSRRREFHLKIAAVLDGPLGLQIGALPGLIATHWKRGGKPRRSFDWWLKAAVSAAEKGQAALAVSFTNQALCAARLVPDLCSPHQEAVLMSILGTQMRALRGGASNETVGAYMRALRLVAPLPSKPGDIDLDIAWGIAAIHLVRGEVNAATDASCRLMSDAAERGRDDILVLALRLHGTSRLLLGYVEEAVETLQTAVARYDRDRHGDMYRRYVSDPGASALAHLACATAIAGNRAASLEARRKALELAVDIRHSHTLVNVMCVLSLAAMHLDEHGTAVALSRSAETIADRHGQVYWQARSRVILAWASARDDAVAGIDHVCEALADYRRIGSGRATAFAACLAAEIAIRAGQPRRALDLLAPVQHRGRIDGEWIYVPEIMRLEAIARSRLGCPGESESAANLLARAGAMSAQHGSTVFLRRIEAAREIIEAASTGAVAGQAKSQRKATAKRFITPAP